MVLFHLLITHKIILLKTSSTLAFFFFFPNELGGKISVHIWFCVNTSKALSQIFFLDIYRK